VRVPVYLSPKRRISTLHGEIVTASFFAPFDRRDEPYIRIATGDYPELQTSRGRDNALSSFISSLAHEIIHYRQWVETGRCFERGVVRRARTMLRNYARTVPRP
jgi:hypothetical protein